MIDKDIFVISTHPHQKKKSLGLYIANENCEYKIASFSNEKSVDMFLKHCNKIEKELKALEIIKNKNFDLFYLRDSKDLDMYNDACDYFRNLCYLTQKEYDLLKEVLV